MTADMFFFAFTIIFAILSLFLFIKIRRVQKILNETRHENETFRERYTPIINIDEAIEKRRKHLYSLEEKFNNLKPIFEKKHHDLSEEYAEKMEIYRKLKEEVDKINGTIDALSFGLYEPYFDYDTPEKFKDAIKKVRDEQKRMIRDDSAAPCDKDWQVDGSAAEGKKMVKRQTKLMLRAFNSECDAIISKVKWDNVKVSENRIQKAWENINKSGDSISVSITPEYLDLKLRELHLNFEMAVKKQEIKEEQRRIREEMREEEKARRELEKAKKDAEAEEQRYVQALQKAREELEAKHGENTDAFRRQIAELEAQLAEAHEKSQRAISRAQQTRSGHVYIISNIGSFGKHVYKIGMTRRLDPMDRVKELGDASVPFGFDVHGMIYTEDAPTLERELHERFNDRRLNLVNNRKEFFKVSLAEIQEAVSEKGLEVELTQAVEAQEYRETLAMRREMLAKKEASSTDSPHFNPVTSGLPENLPSSI